MKVKKEEQVISRAVALAEKWQTRATELVNNFDKKFHVKMNKMLSHPTDKVLLIELLDQSFRSHNSKRVANQVEYIFKKYQMASFFTTPEKFLVWAFMNVGKYLPDISVPLLIEYIRGDSKTVVLQGEDAKINAHLEKRRNAGDRVNLNLIGEAVLGEDESQERTEKYLSALENPNIDYISIKISTIFSQINPLSKEDTINELVERLTLLYRQAKKYSFATKDGNMQNKFINLDMEEYRDLAITYEVFTRTLELDEFKDFYAGIVLQAYLPDSHLWQKKLTAWAKKRVENGGHHIKLRLVKGANMEMEETESGLKGWPVAPYQKKIDTDSNYKQMVDFALTGDNAKYVFLSTASHNLFELAYARELAISRDLEEYHGFEMLEGMCESARLAIKEISGDVVLYGPTAKKEQFTNAIAYLVRRLDENTGVDNFIRYSFGMKVGSADWENQKKKFLDSFDNVDKIFVGAKRVQDRTKENWDNFEGSYFTKTYKSEVDTDFVLPQNQDWARGIVEKYSDINIEAPVVVGGVDITKERTQKDIVDKSQLLENKYCGKYTLASKDDLENALEVASSDPDGWREKSVDERYKILSKVANNVRKARADLIGVAAAEVGKVFTETDVEVSEAIDFLEFYPHSVEHFENFENIETKGKGVGLVIPPWNFPVAIPVGGVTAALAAGNTVILKPASVAVLCSYMFCKCFWDAGVSKNTLQFVPCPGSLAGDVLIPDERVSFVILTGGESTAYSMLKAREDLFLTAETGGKDATIVTAMADRDQAIKNVLHSAFSNSGQKCSATSLLVLEEEVYNDPHFKKGLVDAAKTMTVGSVWNLKSKIGTLANELGGELKQAVETLDSGEEWALAPSFAENNKFMLKPSIKWGVKEGSFCHMTELFGPVLSVMKAKNLEDAVRLVNMTGYGLTSGIETLDEREIEYWKNNIKAGNLYINRGTTGAIVLRQPFGGLGKSAVGAGRKAGHYNYVTQFMDYKEVSEPKVEGTYYHPFIDALNSWEKEVEAGAYKDFAEELAKTKTALKSYLEQYDKEFSVGKDYFKLRGEDNVFKYLPVSKVALRVTAKDSLFDVLSRILAAKISKVPLHVSVEADANTQVVSFVFEHKDKILSSSDSMTRESEEAFVKCFKDVSRIIYADPKNVSKRVYAEAAKLAKFIVRQKPLMGGRLELLNYFDEQSISHSYHRYGNLGARAVR
ncbi:MAG: proline dehydrogenase family protein [Campylobacteraceae bacterium]